MAELEWWARQSPRAKKLLVYSEKLSCECENKGSKSGELQSSVLGRRRKVSQKWSQVSCLLRKELKFTRWTWEGMALGNTTVKLNLLKKQNNFQFFLFTDSYRRDQYIPATDHSFPTLLLQLLSVQSLSRIWLFVTPWAVACQASLSLLFSRSLRKLMSIESVITSNHLILCRPLLLLPSIFPSISGLFVAVTLI